MIYDKTFLSAYKEKYKQMLFFKALYKQYLRENKILLSPSFCILFMPDSDNRLWESTFRNFESFFESRGAKKKYKKIAIFYADVEKKEQFVDFSKYKIQWILITKQEMNGFLSYFNFFYIDTRIRIISFDKPYLRRCKSLIDSGRLSVDNLVRFAMSKKIYEKNYIVLGKINYPDIGRYILNYLLLPFFTSLLRIFPFSVCEFIYYKFIVLPGCKLLENISEENSFLGVCTYPGSGDVYLASAYLQQEKRSKLTICVNKKGNISVSKLFFPDINVNYIALDSFSVLKLFRAVLFLVPDEARVKILHHQPPFAFCCIADSLKNVSCLNFNEIYRYVVFDNRYCEINPPVFPDFDTEVSNFFLANSLKRRKTVLLSPFSNTIPHFADDFFKVIAKVLKKKGYNIVVNCSEKENFIPDSLSVLVEYKWLKSFLETGGYFIGVRSGLCDIISSIDCKKVVIYPYGVRHNNGSFMDFFSLKNMKLCENLLEFEYKKNKRDSLNLILDYLGEKNDC